jgi:hypothetical protein
MTEARKRRGYYHPSSTTLLFSAGISSYNFVSIAPYYYIMNTLFSTTVKVCDGYGKNNKQDYSLKPESLFSMAIYDMDHSRGRQQQDYLGPLPANAYTQPSFYPVEECNDLSLKELLDLSDDYLFDHEEDNNMINSSMLNPVPLNVPYDQNVASVAASQAYTEHVVPIRMGNQIQPTMDHTEATLFNEGDVPIVLVTSCQSPDKKRRRVSLNEESDDALHNDGRFRPYQAGQWGQRFNDLCLFREEHGNCLVPHTYKENLPLSRWVKRQRYQYKLRMIDGKSSSTMSEERVTALEEIGFVWDSQGAAWGERLDELKEFRSNYLHCNVSSNYSENPPLATWVKCQRRQYKLYKEGSVSNMTAQRVRDLEAVGFEWLLRSQKKQRTM